MALSRRLGRSDNDYVVLAEGNTSLRLDDGIFPIKASGARLAEREAGDIVRLRLEPLLDAVLDAGERDVPRSITIDWSTAPPEQALVPKTDPGPTTRVYPLRRLPAPLTIEQRRP